MMAGLLSQVLGRVLNRSESVCFGGARKTGGNRIFAYLRLLVEACAALHSITSSARPTRGSGMVNPRALAVFKLFTNSTLVDWTTGRSAGLAP